MAHEVSVTPHTPPASPVQPFLLWPHVSQPGLKQSVIRHKLAKTEDNKQFFRMSSKFQNSSSSFRTKSKSSRPNTLFKSKSQKNLKPSIQVEQAGRGGSVACRAAPGSNTKLTPEMQAFVGSALSLMILQHSLDEAAAAASATGQVRALLYHPGQPRTERLSFPSCMHTVMLTTATTPGLPRSPQLRKNCRAPFSSLLLLFPMHAGGDSSPRSSRDCVGSSHAQVQEFKMLMPPTPS